MRILVLAVVVLSGCALTPAEVVEQGRKIEWTSALSPRTNADCLARNAENFSGTVVAQVRPSSDGSAIETVVRMGEAGVLSMTQSRASGAGSRVTTWIGPNVLTPDWHFSGLTKGC